MHVFTMNGGINLEEVAMKREEIIKFANENKICFMAINEKGMAHVRIMKLWFADKSGFYFETLSPLDISRQIHSNPKVEVCFYNNPKDLKEGRELRIAGDIEFVTDAAILNKARKERQYLGDLGEQPVESYIEVFKLSHGEAHFWRFKANVLEESVLDHMMF